MNKIINGRRYDTEKAKKVAEAYSKLARNDFGYWEEELYRKRTGEFFLYGWGGPSSRYSVSAGLNSWSGGEKIIPLTIEEAQEWAEKHLDGDEYEEIFGEIIETDEKKTVTLSLNMGAIEALKRKAAAEKISLSEFVERLILKA